MDWLYLLGIVVVLAAGLEQPSSPAPGSPPTPQPQPAADPQPPPAPGPDLEPPASVCVGRSSYFVSPVGNDHGPGNQTQPFHTLARAFAAMQPGDRLFFRGGIYPEIAGAIPNGIPSCYTLLSAWQNEPAAIRPESLSGFERAIYLSAQRYIEFDGFILDGSAHSVDRRSCALVWPEVNSGTQAIMLDSCSWCDYTQTAADLYTHHIRLRNLEIKNWPGYAISVGGPNVAAPGVGGNVELLNCRIHDVGQNVYNGNNVAVYMSTPNWLVEGCSIFDVPAGITVFKQESGQGTTGPTGGVIRYNEIFRTGNVPPDCPRGGPAIMVAHWQTDVQIYANHIHDNFLGGIRFGIYDGRKLFSPAARQYGNTFSNNLFDVIEG